MAGFYLTQYMSDLGGGGGAFYIGNGIVVGTDALGGVYEGSYIEADGFLSGTARLRVPDGGLLATGEYVRANEPIEVRFSLPATFDNGEPHAIEIGKSTIDVSFRWVRDLP